MRGSGEDVNFSFSSPKTDNAPAGVEDFDVPTRQENRPLVFIESDVDLINEISEVINNGGNKRKKTSISGLIELLGGGSGNYNLYSFGTEERRTLDGNGEVRGEKQRSYPGNAPRESDADYRSSLKDFDVQKKDVTPELQKMLDDHDVVKSSDGSVRTLAQERAAQAAEASEPPAMDKQIANNPDIAAIVEDRSVKRADDKKHQSNN